MPLDVNTVLLHHNHIGRLSLAENVLDMLPTFCSSAEISLCTNDSIINNNGNNILGERICTVSSDDRAALLCSSARGVARTLIWVGINVNHSLQGDKTTTKN